MGEVPEPGQGQERGRGEDPSPRRPPAACWIRGKDFSQENKGCSCSRLLGHCTCWTPLHPARGSPSLTYGGEDVALNEWQEPKVSGGWAAKGRYSVGSCASSSPPPPDGGLHAGGPQLEWLCLFVTSESPFWPALNQVPLAMQRAGGRRQRPGDLGSYLFSRLWTEQQGMHTWPPQLPSLCSHLCPPSPSGLCLFVPLP